MGDISEFSGLRISRFTKTVIAELNILDEELLTALGRPTPAPYFDTKRAANEQLEDLL